MTWLIFSCAYHVNAAITHCLRALMSNAQPDTFLRAALLYTESDINIPTPVSLRLLRFLHLGLSLDHGKD